MNDDYIFNMILKRGHIVSKKNEIYVEVIDIAELDEYNLVFKMTVLEASVLSEKYPAFESQGLLAQWKLDSANNLIKLYKIFENNSFELTRAFLLDSASNVIVRERYNKLYK